MATLKQIVCNHCYYQNEYPDCPKFCPLDFKDIKEWLQQKQIPKGAYANEFRKKLLEELEHE